MFCPECGAEYRPGFSECAECRVYLVASLPEGWTPTGPVRPVPTPDVKLIPVFKTTDVTLLPIVRSLLDSAGVRYSIQGEEALGLLPVGAMGSNVSRASLGATIYVTELDASSVKHLLSEIESDFPDPVDDPDDPDDPDDVD